MRRRDLAPKLEKKKGNKPALNNRSKQHFAADAGENKIMFEGAAFRSIIRGAQDIARVELWFLVGIVPGTNLSGVMF